MPSPLRIDQLPAASPLTGAEAFPAAQGGTAKKGLLSQVLAYITANLPAFTFPFAGLVYSPSSGGTPAVATGAQVAQAAGGALREAQEGTITQFGSMVALTDRFITANSGGLFSLNTLGQVVASEAQSGSSSSFGHNLLLPTPTVRENFVARLRYIIANVDSNTYGMSLFLRSINPYVTLPDTGISLFSASNYAVGGLQMVRDTPSNRGITPINQSGTFTIANGDELEIEFGRRGVTLYGYARNLTQGCSRYIEATQNLQTASNFNVPNTSRLGFSINGGTFTITEFSYLSTGLVAPDLFAVGDSKTCGSDAGILEGRWASVAARTNGLTLRVEAGGGDRTAEAAQTIPTLKLTPRCCINALGYNDIAAGVSDATWQANYQAITGAMQAWGGKVYHLLPIPSTAYDTSALRAWQLATYPGLTIDPAVGFNTGTMLDGDGIHPNLLGHQTVGATVAAYLSAHP